MLWLTSSGIDIYSQSNWEIPFHITNSFSLSGLWRSLKNTSLPPLKSQWISRGWSTRVKCCKMRGLSRNTVRPFHFLLALGHTLNYGALIFLAKQFACVKCQYIIKAVRKDCYVYVVSNNSAHIFLNPSFVRRWWKSHSSCGTSASPEQSAWGWRKWCFRFLWWSGWGIHLISVLHFYRSSTWPQCQQLCHAGHI